MDPIQPPNSQQLQAILQALSAGQQQQQPGLMQGNGMGQLDASLGQQAQGAAVPGMLGMAPPMTPPPQGLY